MNICSRKFRLLQTGIPPSQSNMKTYYVINNEDIEPRVVSQILFSAGLIAIKHFRRRERERSKNDAEDKIAHYSAVLLSRHIEKHNWKLLLNEHEIHYLFSIWVIFYGWINLYDVPKALLFVFVYRNFTTNSLDSFHYKPKTYIRTNWDLLIY